MVSSDILRVSGYTQQFRSLLTARFSPRRESVPNVHLETEHEEKARREQLMAELGKTQNSSFTGAAFPY
ncbi:hypothetical protein ANCCAN_15189 [Ancylostoma caninum]|uniref:Uncharacterized protein n=1 Tax=Ancylostoma caninum TaxID=29170 RepID=A0A368G7F1_ANCCA|nr:hypothetical protein ANCCAN_15189 [Ancylostoma caninum]